MNAVNKFLIKSILLPKNIYEKLGCDVRQLESIVKLKLTLDDRRPHAFKAMQRNQQETKKQTSNATIWAMLGSFAIGLYFLIFMSFDDDVTCFTLFFTSLCSLLALILISDFTSVLFDVRDNFIILPKPVNDKTFVLAKLIHIIIHVSKLILPLTTPTLLYVVIYKGFFAFLTFLPFIVLATLFTIFIINAFYIFVLKVTTPEKFKNIITYIQILFAISIYASMQILPRKMESIGDGFKMNDFYAAKFFPTYWFAHSLNAIYSGTLNQASIVYIVLSIAFPIFCIYVVIKYFAPSFNQKLSQISGSSSENVTVKVAHKEKQKFSYSSKWAKAITQKGEERMGFMFTWKMMLRSRDFKLKVYPGIGYMIVILFISFMNKKSFNLSNLVNSIKVQDTSGKVAVLMIIYFSSLLISTALGSITMSDKYKASWLYFITPIYEPGKIFLGAVKAVSVMFFAPFAMLALTVGVAFVGVNIIPNVVLACVNQIIIIGLYFLFGMPYLPFSTSTYKPSAGSIFKGFFALIIAALIGLLHYFVYNYIYAVMFLIVVGCSIIYFMQKHISNFSWQKVLSVYRED